MSVPLFDSGTAGEHLYYVMSFIEGAGRALAGHYVLAGVLVSLAACAAAFVLLDRLADEKLGEAGARRAVLGDDHRVLVELARSQLSRRGGHSARSG